MDRSIHNLNTLFSQLGLADSNHQIEAFINKHRGIPGDIRLDKASLWNQSQAEFLADAIYEDSDWSEVVDTLDTLLR